MNNNIITLTIDQLTQLLLNPSLTNIQQSLQHIDDSDKISRKNDLKNLVSFLDQDEFQVSSTQESNSNSLIQTVQELIQDNQQLRLQLEKNEIFSNKIQHELKMEQGKNILLSNENKFLKQQLSDQLSNLRQKGENSQSVHQSCQQIKRCYENSGISKVNPLFFKSCVKTERNFRKN